MSENPPSGPRSPAGRPSYAVAASFDYGWKKFWVHLGPFLVGVLAMFGVFVVLAAIGLVITSAALDDGGVDASWFQVLTPLLVLVAFLLTYLIYVGLVRGALGLTDGRPGTAATIFRAEPLPQLMVAALLVGILVSAGTFLCVVPGLLVAFFTQFTAHFMIDEEMGALAGIKASFDFVTRNPGPVLAFSLASLVALFLGALLCGLGLVLATPVVIIASAHIYRTLRGDPVTD